MIFVYCFVLMSKNEGFVLGAISDKLLIFLKAYLFKMAYLCGFMNVYIFGNCYKTKKNMFIA